jgi:hypothetical protein
MVEKAEEITGKKIKRLYIDRGFYDEENFVWLDKKKHVEYFRFIAYNIVSIFKRALTEKYRKACIEVLKRDTLHKIAVISFNAKSVKFEFNRKYEILYNEQLASINEFISQTRDKIELTDVDVLA